MDHLFIRDKFNKCELCAYHEAGHILFAYLCGYTCKEVQLIPENNEEGFSSYAVIDYGKDAWLASHFLSDQTEIDFFKCLSLGERLESIEAGRRLARIFLGGSVAAAVYNNSGNVQIPLPMQIDLLDLMRVEFIQDVMREISSDGDDNFIEYGLQDALYTLSNVNVWQTVADLAARLLERNLLDRNDIEECLDEHGIVYDEESPADAGFHHY